jgi:hypothetical protein
MKLRDIIAAGIRQYCSDKATEYAYHEPARDISLLARLDMDADQLADYIATGFMEGHAMSTARSEFVRREAAQTALAASKKTGRPVDPRVAELAGETP